jgi:predicted dinucleotide-binding enzyme
MLVPPPAMSAEEVLEMATAIIGTGGVGSAIARRLASGGETLRLASADSESARTLAEKIGPSAAAAADNGDALRGADAVVLALRFGVLKGVIDEIAGAIGDTLVVVPSNPVSLDAHGNVVRVLPTGQSSGEVVAGWLPAGARLVMAFGTMSAPLFEASSNRSLDPHRRFRAGEGRRAQSVGSTRSRGRPSRSRRRPRRGAHVGGRYLTASLCRRPPQ